MRYPERIWYEIAGAMSVSKPFSKELYKYFHQGYLGKLGALVECYQAYAFLLHTGRATFPREDVAELMCDMFNHPEKIELYPRKHPYLKKLRHKNYRLKRLAFSHFDEDLISRIHTMQDEEQPVDKVLALFDDLCLLSYLTDDIKTGNQWEKAIIEGWLHISDIPLSPYDQNQLKKFPSEMLFVDPYCSLPDLYDGCFDYFWDVHIGPVKEDVEDLLGYAECSFEAAQHSILRSMLKDYVFTKRDLDVFKRALHASEDEAKMWWGLFLQSYPIIEDKDDVWFDFDELMLGGIIYDRELFCEKHYGYLLAILSS